MSARNIANIANAQHSTGPRSEEGKQRASQNVRRHGLTAKTLVLETEDPAAFEALRAALRSDYGPKTELEDALLDTLVESHWRLLRLRRAEVAFHNQCIKQLRQENPGLDPDSALGLMLADPKASAQLRLFLRYQSPIERAYRDAEKKLLSVIRTRLDMEHTRRTAACLKPFSLSGGSLADELAALAMPLPPPVGFVSQPGSPAAPDPAAGRPETR